MSRRLMVAVAAIAVLGAGTTGAVAAKKSAPAKSIRIVGELKFKPGKSVTDNQRFQSRSHQVKSGGTIKFVNKAKTEDPHTISFVNQLPKSFECEECGAIEEAHAPSEDGPPANMQVDSDGDGGFNTAGDSIFVAPPGGPGSSGELNVTAPAGTTLKFLCLIHPWMQGKLKVTK